MSATPRLLLRRGVLPPGTARGAAGRSRAALVPHPDPTTTPTPSRPPPPPTTASTAPEILPITGIDSANVLLSGVALVAAGSVLLAASRPRRRGRHAA